MGGIGRHMRQVTAPELSERTVDVYGAGALHHGDDLLTDRMSVSCRMFGALNLDDTNGGGGIYRAKRVAERSVGQVHELDLAGNNRHVRSSKIDFACVAISVATVAAKSEASASLAQPGSPYQPASSISVTSVM